jgi:kynurenine 3-monooxygenase
MLIALPNSDGSLTGTLFLAQKGLPGFDQLDAARVGRFFDSQFPDALPLMPELVQQFSTHPIGLLGTVHCRPWHVIRRSAAGTTWQLLLLGDAAHAIVPFHGQGLNAAFEDCIVLDRMIEAMDGDWSRILPAFDAARRPDTEAIAEMSQENYREMRDGVRAPDFERRGALAFELERRHPDRFIPRYSMVMFHPEIGYADAQSRGRIQAGIIDDLLRLKGIERMILADRLILERLPPVR